MTTIDIAFFPHIFDLIYEAADFRALLRLRLTCRALRDRINDEWGHLTWFLPEKGQAQAVNHRGVVVPCNSPCLSFTSVLDVVCEGGRRSESSQLREHLQPEIIRFNQVAYTPLTEYAKTIIFLDEEQGDVGSDFIYRPSPDLEPVNLIYKLDCCDGLGERRFDFDNIGDISWSAEVFLVLSGCHPVESCVKDLCWSIMDTLVGEYSAVWVDPPPTHKVNFYLVDVPSWFDQSLTSLPEDDPRRLDQVLTKPGTFYSHMLKQVGFNGGVLEDSEYEYERCWPCQKVLGCLFQQVHCISREQMRQRIGDKAYNLTFAAPMGIWAPWDLATSSSRSSRTPSFESAAS